MRLKTAFIIILVFSLSGFRLSVAQQQSQCLAVITALNGDVLIKKDNKTEFVKAYWGTQLFQGDQIRTSANSEVTLTLSNSSFIRLGSNSMITISGNETIATEKSGNVREISSAAMIDLSALTLKRDSKTESGALAGLRSDNTEKTIELTSPYNTLIKTYRPLFSWTANTSFDNYIVNLYNSKGLVWKKKVSDSMMDYPESEKDLEYGESYFWNVEGEGLIENEKSGNFKFSVLTNEKLKEVATQEALIKGTLKDEQETSSLHSVLGAYYLNQGLLEDAIKEFEIISEMNPEAPLPHEILGSLYSDVGNKDKAIEELQKALALSKGNEK